jgi:hypothetical protein
MAFCSPLGTGSSAISVGGWSVLMISAGIGEDGGKHVLPLRPDQPDAAVRYRAFAL